MIVILVSLTAVAFGGIGAAIALRTGSASVVQGLFPLVFVILFLSSAFFPANLMLEPAASDRRVQPAELHRRGDPRPGDLGAHAPRRSGRRSAAIAGDRGARPGAQRSWRCARRLRTGG